MNDIYFKNPPINIPQTMYFQSELEDLRRNVYTLADEVSRLLDSIKIHQEHITMLEKDLWTIAPELEIIDSIAETEEEKNSMIDSYMNLNKNYC